MKAILLIFLVACSLVTQAKDLPLTGSHSVGFFPLPRQREKIMRLMKRNVLRPFMPSSR